MHGTVRPQAPGYAWLTPWPISFYHYLFYINTQSKFPPKNLITQCSSQLPITLALSLTYYSLKKFSQGSLTEDKDPVIQSIINFEGRKILVLYIKWH